MAWSLSVLALGLALVAWRAGIQDSWRRHRSTGRTPRARLTVVHGCWRIPGQGVLCLGSVPEDGSARGAGSGFVVPRVGRMRARRLCRWLMRGRHVLAGVRGTAGPGNPAAGIGGLAADA